MSYVSLDQGRTRIPRGGPLKVRRACDFIRAPTNRSAGPSSRRSVPRTERLHHDHYLSRDYAVVSIRGEIYASIVVEEVGAACPRRWCRPRGGQLSRDRCCPCRPRATRNRSNSTRPAAGEVGAYDIERERGERPGCGATSLLEPSEKVPERRPDPGSEAADHLLPHPADFMVLFANSDDALSAFLLDAPSRASRRAALRVDRSAWSTRPGTSPSNSRWRSAATGSGGLQLVRRSCSNRSRISWRLGHCGSGAERHRPRRRSPLNARSVGRALWQTMAWDSP